MRDDYFIKPLNVTFMFFCLLVVSAFFGCSDEQKTAELSTQAYRISAEDASTLNFEDYSQWTNTSGNSSTVSQGQYASIVDANGWTEVTSVAISDLGSTIGDTATIDVQVPESPMYWGEIKMIVKVPSLGEWYRDLGSASLSGMSAGSYHTLSFVVPQDLQTKLQGSYDDLVFTIAINGPSGQYLLDNIQMGLNIESDTDSEVPPTDSFTVYLPDNLNPNDVVLGGSEYVKINDRVVIDDYSKVCASNGISGMNLGVDVSMGTAVSEGDVVIRERCTVNGDLRTASAIVPQNIYWVTGEELEYETFAAPNELTLHMGFPWAIGSDVLVPPASADDILPDTYNDLIVYTDSTLTLHAGVYRFRSVQIEPNAQIVLDDATGPVVLLVSDSMFYRGSVSNLSGTFPQWFIGYSGTDMITFERTFRGTVMAPQAKINLEAVAIPGHEGNFYGNEIELFQDVKIAHSPFTGWDDICGEIISGNCETPCPPDYVKENGECIHTKMVNCNDAAPQNANSTIVSVEITYSDANGWSSPGDCEWTCNTDYTLEDGACINSKLVDCIDATPANAVSAIQQVEVTYTTAEGWTLPAECAWNCNTDYILEGEICINSKFVDCADVAPTNATSDVELVEITYTTDGGWSTPTDCLWSCNTDYSLEGGGCINSKMANCIDLAPSNATSVVTLVEITYTTAGGWTTPVDCSWNCNSDYTLEGGICINSKFVNCNDEAPSNATSVIASVEISFATSGGWTNPADCTWNCDNNYVLENGACINSKLVACIDVAPNNATATVASVEVTYTTAGGWSTPADCEWNCDTDYTLESGVCINSQHVDCIDAAPTNATSVVEQVEITYTTAGGWSTPSNCSWNCDTDYALESGICINSKLVDCTDVAPSNATSVVEQVEITYTTAGGWSSAADCTWNCNTNFTLENSVCINSKLVDCSDVAPNNASSIIEQVEIFFTSAEGWSGPADCAWECNTDYALENGACINSKQVDCADVAPGNATSASEQVEITYTTVGGWTTPADCVWNCDTDFVLESGVCINSKLVDCTDVAPTNATSVVEQIAITYTSAAGWSVASDCSWNCDTDYTLEAGACINSKLVNCTDVAPNNASSTVAQVEITYTSVNGWSTPEECSWNCDTDYTLEGGTCINSKQVDCIDAAPTNATSVVEQVEIAYTTAGGWSTPTDCAWNCDTDFTLENGACINSKVVDCTDVAPNNASSIIELVEITYTTAGGWSSSENCSWNCNIDYTLEGGICINSNWVDCTDVAPTNASSTIVQVEITYTSANGWSTPADCSWNCDTNYTYEDEACINSKLVECTDVAPPNATSVIAQVEIIYTTADGWTTPTGCAWNCDIDFDLTGGACINTQTVNCNNVAPANATSVYVPVTITYNTAGGWTTVPDCEWECDTEYILHNDSCVPLNCIVKVDVMADASIADGTSWETAFTKLQDGIDAAAELASENYVCEVWVAEGEYFTYENARTNTVLLADYVNVYGGFNGTEIQRQERDYVTNETILDGNEGPAENNVVYHVVSGANNATIDGFTIRDGAANGTGDNVWGGGLYIRSTSPTISNCIFTENTAIAGGGIGAYHSVQPLIENCTFISNRALRGGAIRNYDNGNPIIQNCQFYNNVATSADGLDGGGAIYSSSSAPTIDSCIFKGNRAEQQDGGAIYNYLSNAIIENSVIYKNYAYSFGGAIYNYSCSPSITNCTITENNNSAIRNWLATSQPSVVNTIIWGNGGVPISEGNSASSIVTYSNIEGGHSGEGNINSEPLFVSAERERYDLRPNSPCIDAGTGDGAPDVDLIDTSRWDDPGTDNTGGGTPDYVDMGAYEVHVCSDSNCEFGCVAGRCMDCAPGTCCDDLGYFESSGTICDDNPAQEYYCSSLNTCGSTVLRTDSYQTCNGFSTDCGAGELEIHESIVDDVCLEGACVEEGEDTYCEMCDLGCDGGCLKGIDLIPTSIDISSFTIDPNTMEMSGEISATIERRGDVEQLIDFSIVFFEDINANGIWDRADTTIASEHIWGQSGDELIEVNVTVTDGYYALFQDNLIYMYVDSERTVEETNEENNSINNMSSCEYEPEVGNFEPVVEWVWSGSEMYPSYQKVLEAPVVAQLNDDNADGLINERDIPDIVFVADGPGCSAACSGTLRAVSGDGSGDLWAVKNPFVNDDENPDAVAVFRGSANPIAADIDNDGKVEILSYDSDANQVIAVENDGRFKWRSPIIGTDEFYHGRTLSVADIDQDGSPDIICGKGVLNANGSIKWDGPTNESEWNLPSTVGTYLMGTAVNLDMVGDMEVIAGAVALRSDGTIYWHNSNLENARTAVGNFDDDLYPEVVAVSNGYLYLLEHDGTSIWGPIDLPPIGTSSDTGGPPTIADFDGDGSPEIGVAGGRAYTVFEGNGDVLWSKTISDLSSNVTGSAVFDFEGDGSAEVVYRDEYYLRVYRGRDGEVLLQVPMRSGTHMELPVIADVDNDANAEIIITGNPDIETYAYSSLFIIGDANDTWVNTRKIWNQHGYHITNVEDNGAIPEVEAFSWLEHNSYRQNNAIDAKACADLSASILRVTANYVDSAFTMTVRVGNSGAVQVGKGVPVSFYYGNPNVDGIFLGATQTTSRLWPGDYEDVAIEIFTELTGVLELYALVDSDENGVQSVSEVNEYNNLAMTAYDLCEDGSTQECGSVVGACSLGVRTCLGGIWGACELAVFPMEELCDGIDNDCDGSIDEMVVAECSSACGKGTMTCLDGAWLECSARQPEPEICDGVDNNCDGKIDETCECDDGYIRFCGRCIGQCEVGISTCIDGDWSECLGYVGPSEEICDLIDNDCDGLVDESCICEEGTIVECGDDEGACVSGTQECLSDGSWSQCTATPPTLEICDGIDNDCDAEVDEDLEQTCSTLCGEGIQLCESGAWSDCTAPSPLDEVCDGIDNDCDGSIDEEIAIVCETECGVGIQNCVSGALTACIVDGAPENYGQSCSSGIGICRAFGTINCAGACTASAGIGESTDTCWDGLDNNCNGYVDEQCPEDFDPPVVAIYVDDGDEFYAPTSIYGKVYDEKYLAEWRVEVTENGSDNRIEIASGTSNIIDDKIAELDPTIFTNGMYDIRVSAIDGTGHEVIEEVPIFITGERKIGQFAFAFEDISIPVHGIPVTVTRTYNNQDKFKGDFGVGWDMTLGTGIKIQRTKPIGEGYWARNLNPAGFDYWVLETHVPSKIFITFPDGHQERFEADLQFEDVWLRDSVVVSFTPLGDTTSKLQLTSGYDCRLNGGNITNETAANPIATFDPDSYALTTQEGITYFISRTNGLYGIKDLNGNYIDINRDRIVSSNDAQIFFDRDSDNRITRIWDYFTAETQYEYDLNGDLVRFTDQSGNLWQYGYDTDHNLLSVVDPRGIEILENTYDEQGRLIATADGFGEVAQIEHNIDELEERITDRNGNLTRYYYDELGRVTEEIGPDDARVLYTYNTSNDKLSETHIAADGTELTTTYAYEYDFASRMTKKVETDPLGHSTTYEFDSSGDVVKETNALGQISENVYSYRNLIKTTRYLDGSPLETSNTYYTTGALTSSTDPLGNTTTYLVDFFGNSTGRIDAMGHRVDYELGEYKSTLKQREYETVTTDSGLIEIETRYFYDEQDRLIITIHPDGLETVTEYNEIGKRSASVDKDGRRTEYIYDENGNMVRTIFFDGTSDYYTFDANGNKLSYTDRIGATTYYEYDVLNRLVKTTFPDSTFSTTEYNLLGHVKAEVDAAGNRTEFEYDAAGRKILERDATGNETTYQYDEVGNVTHVTGPTGESVEYIYDDLGRKVETIYPENTLDIVGYDLAGRVVLKTGQNGVSMEYEYDALGRLTHVIEDAGTTTSYAYDERGNKLSETDAESQTTEWGYDFMGRKIRRTLPLGQSEYWTYYENGNVQTHTDFEGKVTTYYYDDHSRVERIEYDDGSEVRYTYDIMGRRTAVVDSRGTTSYEYDVRGRVTLVTNPDGSQVGYTYDENGNKAGVITINGTTSYTYDALNRIETVTDDSGVTVYTYDLNGKQNTVTYPNGTVADYDYDTLGRLTYLENRTAGGEIISSYAYTLDALGNRTRVVENDGRTVDYTYDDQNKLLTETINDGVSTEMFTYVYDAVGNRLSKEHCVDTDCEQTVYTYNLNNQLITETVGTEVTQYFYDSNGNTVEKDVDGVVTSYGYDDLNRLVSVTPGEGGEALVEFEYDADGARVAKKVDGETVEYLLDKNQRYHQVLEERDSAGALIAEYVYGNQRISMNRDGEDRFYHYDGHGSTSALSDSDGLVTDTYQYEAFGNLLASTGIGINPFLYTGEAFDAETGLEYLRARYYAPGSGRFVTMDSWEGNKFLPLSLNKYLYADGSPVMKSDPSGYYATIVGISIGISIVGILSSIPMPTYASGLKNNGALSSSDGYRFCRGPKKKCVMPRKYWKIYRGIKRQEPWAVNLGKKAACAQTAAAIFTAVSGFNAKFGGLQKSARRLIKKNSYEIPPGSIQQGDLITYIKQDDVRGPAASGHIQTIYSNHWHGFEVMEGHMSDVIENSWIPAGQASSNPVWGWGHGVVLDPFTDIEFHSFRRFYPRPPRQ